MAENSSDLVKSELLAWARGIYPTEAATRLLVDAFDGRFARSGWPWIQRTEFGNHYVDGTRLGDDEIGMLSGGERRVLAIVRSLLGEQPVDLSDAITGLDPRHARLVIDSLAHATGERPNHPGASGLSLRSTNRITRTTSRRPNGTEPKGMTR